LPSGFFEIVKIPRSRIGALVGKEGETKRRIEKLANVKIGVDSETGDIEINGKPSDALNFYNAASIVKAVGRGFSPEKALLLLDSEFMLDVIKVSDIAGNSENAIKTKKGRVIGRGGMARKAIEKETGANIAVFGKTISVVGNADSVQKARRAIEMLLRGARHSSVEDFLRKRSAEERKFTI